MNRLKQIKAKWSDDNLYGYTGEIAKKDIDWLIKIIEEQQKEMVELQIESSKKLDKLMKIHQIINER